MSLVDKAKLVEAGKQMAWTLNDEDYDKLDDKSKRFWVMAAERSVRIAMMPTGKAKNAEAERLRQMIAGRQKRTP